MPVTWLWVLVVHVDVRNSKLYLDIEANASYRGKNISRRCKVCEWRAQHRVFGSNREARINPLVFGGTRSSDAKVRLGSSWIRGMIAGTSGTAGMELLVISKKKK